ncbi:MAG TPA: hypothetical protein VE174_05655 [Actinomycetota bacterium]|nr:hypothetical protein [Actinomycetota bacterium]
MRLPALLVVSVLLLGSLDAGVARGGTDGSKCPPYPSPRWAGDVPTTFVPDSATARRPIEVTLATGPGAGTTDAGSPKDDMGEISHVFHNVVVAPDKGPAMLFARAEYLPAFDYDLFLRAPGGSSVAFEWDLNPAAVNGPSPMDSSFKGHAEPGVSQIDGYGAPRCVGYTIDLASGLTPGGPVLLKLWIAKRKPHH